MAVTWKALAYASDVIANTLLSAKGDIVYASAANTPARLAVGTDNQILAVNVDVPNWEAAGTPGAHAASHQDGGGDEVSVAALSGLLADDQHVLDTEVTAVIVATPLNDLATADGAVDCGGQQFTDLVLENSAEPPTAAVIGKIYFDTDLNPYVCTVAA